MVRRDGKARPGTRAALSSSARLGHRGHNWIDGEHALAESGAWFEGPSADGREVLGRWPRSGADDLGRALAAARHAESSWRDLGVTRRHDILREAAACLLDAPDPDDTARRALGFSDDEFEAHLDRLDSALREGLALDSAAASMLARSSLGARDGPCLLAPTWSSGWHAPARAALFALRAGRPVVFAADGRLPGVGDALQHAFEHLPRGVFGLLHDDGRTVVRAACERGDLASALVGAERLGSDPWSGSHVEIVRGRRTTVVVDPAQDIDARVERIVDAWIGRARALSGARSGQVGRVFVPERTFSRFSKCLLEHLASSTDAARPLPLAVRAQSEVLESAAALGLDEGTTAILTGFESDASDFPVVLTNVEPTMRVARHAAPCGLLLLLRAHDVRSAHAAALRLDQEFRS